MQHFRFLLYEYTDHVDFLVIIIIGIKHGFSCINIRQVPWEVLKTEAKVRANIQWISIFLQNSEVYSDTVHKDILSLLIEFLIEQGPVVQS